MVEQAAVAEGGRRWNELVAEWQQLDEQEEQATTGIQWRRGDILLEVEPPAPDGVNTGAYQRLRKFAAEVGREFETIIKYRQTAAAWPAGARRADASFAAHYELKNHPDRFDLIQSEMSSRAARIAAGKQPPSGSRPELLSDEHRQQRASDVIQTLTPEQKAEVARQLLEEEEVTEQVVSNPQTVERIERARSDAGRQRLANAGLYRVPDEPADLQTEALAEIQENVHAIKVAYRRIHDLLDSAPLTAVDREQVNANLTECQKWADLAFRKAAGSASDAEFRALLEEGV
jgi:hypothetical protein